MTVTKAYAAPSAGAPLRPTNVFRRPVGPHDVRIDIKFCGICHSDIHQARAEWGDAIFPMVPGHEIAGTVAATGSEITRFVVGDRVGVGCFVDSCRACDNCLHGQQQHCERGEAATYNSRSYDGEPTYGGYSTAIVVDEEFVLRIPNNLELSAAAPLLCAGITMYSPLRRFAAAPGRRVAVVGLGGLGHLGVQIAHTMGAEVSVISQSSAKESDGRRFGADHYVTTAQLAELPATFDLVIDSASAVTDLCDYLSRLKFDGTLVLAGMPSRPFELPVIPLLTNQRRIVGTKNGGIPETQEMLDFCSQHAITPQIEIISGADINDAYERILRGQVRYRYVIDTATL